jgi:hypothetical protein
MLGEKKVFCIYITFYGPPLLSIGLSSWQHNGDVLFPVRYELIYICYVEKSRQPLWSSGQSS